MSVPGVARILMALAAVAMVLLLVSWQRDSEGCTDSVKDVLFALRDDAPQRELDATIEAVEDDCEGRAQRIDTGGVLLQQGEPERAARTFREAADREPESFSAWAGLALALARDDPDGAAEAARRARALNRYYRPPS